MSKRELTEAEALRLWKRAAELQAEATPPESQSPESGESGESGESVESTGYGVDVVRQAALDAGIDSEFVDRALVEVRTDAKSGRLDRMADRFYKDLPKWLTVRRALEVAPEESYAALQRVFPNPPYDFSLIGTRGSSPLEGGRLIFEVPNQVGFGSQGNSTIFDIRQHASIREIEVSLRPVGDDGETSELEITAQLAYGRRVAFLVSHIMGGVAVGVGGLLALLTAANGNPGPSAVFALAGAGAFVGVTRGFRRLYRWAIGRAERAFGRLINAVEVDVSTGGAFAPRGDRGALPGARDLDEG